MAELNLTSSYLTLQLLWWWSAIAGKVIVFKLCSELLLWKIIWDWCWLWHTVGLWLICRHRELRTPPTWNLTKFQLNQTTDRKNENNNCLNELKFCEVSQNSIFNRCWKFQLSILKNKKVLFLKKYILGQERSKRWRLLSSFSMKVLVDAMLLGAQISVKKLLETDGKGFFKLTDLHKQVRL